MKAEKTALRFAATLILLTASVSLSPSVHAGEGLWTTNGPAGGDILALAIDPSSPATLYAGGSSGAGVFKSSNGGESWSPINTGLTSPNFGIVPTVLDLAINPLTPATVYAATVGGGVFKSTNGGANWTAINAGLASTNVLALGIDPTSPATIYAGTFSAGVFKSTDSGGTWAAVNTGLTNLQVWALAIDPVTSATLYAGTSGAGVFKSTNGGGSWSSVNAGLSATGFQEGTGVIALAIDPSMPATLYAGTSFGGGGVFKSTNGGESWTAINAGLIATSIFYTIVIDALAPATLYAGSIVSDLRFGGGGVFKSTNGGERWTAINTGLTIRLVQALAIDPLAPATLYAGTFGGGGVFKSTDRGGSWRPINTGLTTPTVSALAIDPSAPATLYAGAASGSISGVFKTTNGGENWTFPSAQLTNMEVRALAIDPSNPATLYAGTDSYDYSAGVFKSIDGAGTWTAINTGLTSPYVFALAIDPSKPATIYAGTYDGGVFKSTNGGDTWAAVNRGLTGVWVSALAINPATTATLYAGSNDGVFKSTDSGGTWAAVNTGLANLGVQALAINPTTPATLYAGTYGGVFKSTDSGSTWATANTGLTNLFVSSLAINPSNPTTLYAGTYGGGVFRSTDAGGTWEAVNTGLPSLPVNAVALDPTGATTLYAGLAGGGVWQSTPATLSTTALLPTSAHSSGANGAFYTTNVSIANTGVLAASFTLKFLGNNQDGSNGPEKSFNLDPGKSTTFPDVLDSVFHQTSNFGAIRITSNTPTLDVVSVTSTPGFGGTFGQTIPAVDASDLIPAGSSRSILYIREGDGFRSNLILASGASVSTNVDVALVLEAGPWDYLRTRATLATKTYSVPPNGMTQIDRVVRDMGISGPITGARLILSSSTPGAAFTGFVSVIDETTNDPTTVMPQPASVSGSAPFTWLLPTSAHSSGANGAFYTTNLAVANVGAAPASFTMKLLGHNQDGSAGPEQTFNLEAGKSATYFDILGTIFSQTSNFGAIRITSDSPALNVVSVTSTPGFGGSFGQTVPAVPWSNLIPAGPSRSILYIREGDGFRSNLVLASNASVSTMVDAALVSAEGATLAAKSYSVPPNGMTQINRVVRDMGVSSSVTGARLVLSSSTPGAAFTAFVSVIDDVTNDPTTVEAR